MVKYHCKYCNKDMSEYDYNNYNGLCGKCREIQDWKSIVKQKKEMED